MVEAMRPRCPFSRLGLDSEIMTRCPGFIPQAVGGTEEQPPKLTCGHLGLQESTHGFVSACMCPGDPPWLGHPDLGAYPVEIPPPPPRRRPVWRGQ